MTDLTYHLRISDYAAEEKIIRDGLNQYAGAEASLERQMFGAFCYDGDKVVGGITAHLIGGTLSIKLLWVDETYRGRDIGSTLIHKAEEHAIESDITVAFVDTMGYQAPEFYPKLGYSEEARIVNFYAGHDRVFYKKYLGGA